MKILYGVVGEGMGHAMRSRVILEHLLASGHDVEIMASGKACEFLGNRFGHTTRIHGLHMILEDNRVRLGKTLQSNVATGARGIPHNIAAYFEDIGRRAPDVVISDFESWAYLYGKTHRLPILSIDNMQVIHRCTLPQEIRDGHQVAFQLTKAFIKAKLPGCDAYFITAFFRPPARKPDTFIFPPILRPEILAATPSRGDHLLVYQSGSPGLEAALAATKVPCRIYNMRHGLTADVVEGNLTFRPFSEQTFVADLASARGVIGAGGFTLMGEAVYLRKPMLSVPIAKQFEQILNARYLEVLGYGASAEDPTEPGVIDQFLEHTPACERALASYSQDGNREILDAVDRWLTTHART
jgi:uncharacterized protein (TIGR00661 family)